MWRLSSFNVIHSPDIRTQFLKATDLVLHYRKVHALLLRAPLGVCILDRSAIGPVPSKLVRHSLRPRHAADERWLGQVPCYSMVQGKVTCGFRWTRTQARVRMARWISACRS